MTDQPRRPSAIRGVSGELSIVSPLVLAAPAQPSSSTATSSQGGISFLLRQEWFGDPKFSDVSLVVETTNFHVHRLVMATNSPVLAAMLSNGMKETNSQVRLYTEIYSIFVMCQSVPLPGKNAREVPTVFRVEFRLCHEQMHTFLSALYQREDELHREAYPFIDHEPPAEEKKKSIVRLQNVSTLIHLADEYQVRWLTNACFQFLWESFADCCPLW